MVPSVYSGCSQCLHHSGCVAAMPMVCWRGAKADSNGYGISSLSLALSWPTDFIIPVRPPSSCHSLLVSSFPSCSQGHSTASAPSVGFLLVRRTHEDCWTYQLVVIVRESLKVSRSSASSPREDCPSALSCTSSFPCLCYQDWIGTLSDSICSSVELPSLAHEIYF